MSRWPARQRAGDAYAALRFSLHQSGPCTRVILIEARHVLPMFVESLSLKAKAALERMGVEVWNGAKVADIQADHVQVERDGKSERIDTHTVVWAAGVQASSLGQRLSEATGVAARSRRARHCANGSECAWASEHLCPRRSGGVSVARWKVPAGPRARRDSAGRIRRRHSLSARIAHRPPRFTIAISA